MSAEPDWAFCNKCMEMFWNGLPDRKGVCPAGGGHDGNRSFDFSLPYGLPPTSTMQEGWRFCERCMAMFWAGNNVGPTGVCPGSGSAHSPQGFPFVLPHRNDAKTVVVKLHHIFCDNTGDDPGDELEIYGHFEVGNVAVRPDTREFVPRGWFSLFNRSADEAQSLVEGTAFIVESSAALVVFADERLQIKGRLLEQDTIDDDLLGRRDFMIGFDNIENSPIDLGVFENKNQRVFVGMSTALV